MNPRILSVFAIALGAFTFSGIADDQPAAAAHHPAFAVKVTGKGPAMILIPGLACSGEVWDSTVAHFQGRYECHVLTLAGFAGQPPIKPPMMETVRAELVAYIKAKKLDHPVIVGHSLGGYTAFLLASSEPKLVGRIISVDGLPFSPAAMDPSTTEESARPMAEQFRDMIAKSKKEDFLAQNRSTLERMITADTNIDLASGWAAKCDIPSVGEAMYKLLASDLRQKVAAIQTPVLLIGAADFATTPEMEKSAQDAYEGQVAKIPHHKVVMDTHSKHFIMFDDPKFLFQTMDEFLK